MVVRRVVEVVVMGRSRKFVWWVDQGNNCYLCSVGDVVLHVCFPGGQCLLSEDGIAGGRFFHNKLCRDMCIGYACVGPLVISFVVWVGFALLVLLLGFLDYCFEGVVSSCAFGSIFLQ